MQDIAKAARTGPATTVLEGISSGLESAVWALVAIAVAIGAALGLGGGNIGFSLYLVALTGIGMLATTGIVVAEDTFGPVADNAAGIAEMAGEFEGEPERIMVSLDAVGNTTKAVTKGFAIGSAVIAAVALFASLRRDHRQGHARRRRGGRRPRPPARWPAWSRSTWPTRRPSSACSSVARWRSCSARWPSAPSSRTAGTVVQEVRRQFREKPGIMDRTERPDYGAVIDICTTASLRELATPALLAVLTPVIIGFGIGYLALGAFLAAAIVTGQLMANFLSQLGRRVGQRQEVHRGRQRGRQGIRGPQGRRHRRHRRRPVQGHRRPGPQPADQGDEPGVAADAAGHHQPAGQQRVRYVIAAAALVVVLGAIAFSKRRAPGMDAAPTPQAPPSPSRCAPDAAAHAGRSRTAPRGQGRRLIGPGLRLLFVGMNPGLWTAAVNAHFARPGNRFWPALHRAGITAGRIAARRGGPGRRRRAGAAGRRHQQPGERRHGRPTAHRRRSWAEGAVHLRRLVAATRPKVVAMLGLTAYRAAFRVRSAPTGCQAEPLRGGRALGAARPERSERPRAARGPGRVVRGRRRSRRHRPSEYRGRHNPENGPYGRVCRQRRSRPVASAGHADARAGQLPEPAVDPREGRPAARLASIIFAESGLFFGFFLPGDSLLFVAGFCPSDAGGNVLPPCRSWRAGRSSPPWPATRSASGSAARSGPRCSAGPTAGCSSRRTSTRPMPSSSGTGAKTIVLARFVPVVRTFAPIVAGVGNMHYRTFVRFNVSAALLWAVGITTLGYFLGQVDVVKNDIELARGDRRPSR